MNDLEENLLLKEIVTELARKLKRAKTGTVESVVFDRFWGVDMSWGSYPHEARIAELCRQNGWWPKYRDWGKEIVVHRA